MTGAFWRRFLVPGALWLVLFFAIPFGIAVAISLGEPSELGGVIYGFNPANYADALDPLFAPVLLRSVGYAAATAALCLLIGYPMPIKGSEAAFAELAQDDPAIEVSTDDLANGSQFKELAPDERKAWDRVWTEVKA